nr:AAA family ATPase [Prevotella sp.]
MRKYPVGIQSFEKIRNDGYIYIDKTTLVYKMITEGCPYFLSRPRRFGKSLLVSTLAAVFEGRRDLFEAFTTEYGIEQPQLFIATTDWKWEKYPVLRFDFSVGLETVEQFDQYVDNTLGQYEKLYGIAHPSTAANVRMINLISAAEKQTGKKVVVLVDEYDNMMLHSLGNAEKQKTVRERFQNLFGPLKSEDSHLQFVFITGISKFSQMGIFSKLNNLNNISMVPAYETICGISEEELVTTMRPDIELLAQKQGLTYDAMLAALKANYDGYHFGKGKTD